MMVYLIVHRRGEIYKLRFKHEADELFYLEPYIGQFHAIVGWESNKVLTWLEEHGFDHYWESDHD